MIIRLDDERSIVQARVRISIAAGVEPGHDGGARAIVSRDIRERPASSVRRTRGGAVRPDGGSAASRIPVTSRAKSRAGRGGVTASCPDPSRTSCRRLAV